MSAALGGNGMFRSDAGRVSRKADSVDTLTKGAKPVAVGTIGIDLGRTVFVAVALER